HVHWPLCEIDQGGRRLERIRPRHALPSGELRDLVVRDVLDAYVTSPTSCNAWRRAFLARVLPIPKDATRVWVDAYLQAMAPLFGSTRAIVTPQGYYRVHGRNQYAALGFEERLRLDLSHFDRRCQILGRYCDELGITADRQAWQ